MNHSAFRPLRRTWLRTVILAAAGMACGWSLAQKIDDVPPAVQNNVPPNFMFMIDNSGSMNNIVPAAPYSATGTYTTSCATPAPVSATQVVWLKIVAGVPRFTIGTSGG